VSGTTIAEHQVHADLIRRVREGDVAAFEQLFAAYQKRVYNLIYRMVGNEQDAVDLTQETFVRVYNARNRIESDGAFLAWLRTVATNLCRDHFRKVGRTIKADSLDQPIIVDGDEVQREIEDWTDNPERKLEKQELQSAVQRALGSLSAEHREVVVLHHIEGMDVKDIARQVGIPDGTVKSRLARAREELKRKLGHYIV
jgi:RNA polymerase sigma-70 factor (ECF subfamily)